MFLSKNLIGDIMKYSNKMPMEKIYLLSFYELFSMDALLNMKSLFSAESIYLCGTILYPKNTEVTVPLCLLIYMGLTSSYCQNSVLNTEKKNHFEACAIYKSGWLWTLIFAERKKLKE